MPAIITDQFRIANAETFVQSFSGIGTTSYYYSFLGHPNPQDHSEIEYGANDWDTSPPDPRDSFEQESSYHNSMLFMKRITSDDVRMIVPRFNWQNGSIYDRYRHNIDHLNPSVSLDAKTLYESKYIVVNSEFKVYLCINNGEDPENQNGQKSTSEPNFTTTAPQAVVNSTDGYVWKYLFTIPPSDVIKFVTEKYIPLPKEWGTGSTADVFNASTDGKLEANAITIKNRGSGYSFNDGSQITLPIYGDGSGGRVSITIDSFNKVSSATIIDGGSGYTKAFVIFAGVGETGIGTFYGRGLNDVSTGDGKVEVTTGSGAVFEVACPPKGGHGYDINRECGSHRVMIYSKYDTDPDYVTGNDFSRIGIVKNPTVYNPQGGNTNTELLTATTATATHALKLKEADSGADELVYPTNSKITQVVGYNPISGISSIAVGYVASFDKTTHVLKYYQPVGLSTLNSSGYKILPFSSDIGDNVTANITCNGTGAVSGLLHSDFGSTADGYESGRNTVELSNGAFVQLGQTFKKGIAPPDVQRYSGDVIYIDNRQSITRSAAQKEELKIVVEF